MRRSRSGLEEQRHKARVMRDLEEAAKERVLKEFGVMTQARWDSMTPEERMRYADYSALQPQLRQYKHCRVEVRRMNGEIDRFIVGESTGWRPCTLELRNRRSRGGMQADAQYLSVRLVEIGVIRR